MKYEWLDEFCCSLKGTKKDFKEEWNATRYMIRGKMFAMQAEDREGRPIITLKLEPSMGEMMRKQYKDVIPGYYMNKEHWNSVYLEGNVPDDILRDMLDRSHELIFSSLTKKVQKEIMEGFFDSNTF